MRALLIAALLTALTGCIPVSLRSVCSYEDTYFDPQFLGTWGDEGGVWQIAADSVAGTDSSEEEPNGYTVWYTESGKTSHLHGQLTKIGRVAFLDLMPVRDQPSNPGGRFLELMLTRPLHTWVRIAVKDGKLELTPVDLDWLNKTIESDPQAIPHVYADDADWPIITASTEDLRAFIAQHVHDESFFGEMSDLTKIGPPQVSNRNNGAQFGNTRYDSQYQNQTTTTKQEYEQK